MGLIEVKNWQVELPGHQHQVMNYALRCRCPLAVLTNGRQWWFYLPMPGESPEQCKFIAIDIDHQDVESATQNFRALLSRGAVLRGSALKRARAEMKQKEARDKAEAIKGQIKKAIPAAWNQLCQEPDEQLLDLLAARVEAVCTHKPDHESLAEYVAQRADDVPPAPDSWTHSRLHSFTLWGEPHKTAVFKDILVRLCEGLSERHGAEFAKVLGLPGTYFSKDPEAINTPRAILQSEIWVETNLSVNGIKQKCRQLLKLFSYSPDVLQVELVPKAQAANG